MVYYPSLPLIMKTESSSQANLCSQLTNSGLSPERGNLRDTEINTTIHPFQQQQQQQQHQQQHSNKTTDMVIREQPITSITSRLSGAKSLISASSSNISPPIQNYLNSNSSSSIKIEPMPSSDANIYSAAAYSLATGRKVDTIDNIIAAAAAVAPKKPQFKCDQCGMTFGSKSAHTSHKKSHTKIDLMSRTTNHSYQCVDNDEIPSSSTIPVGIPKSPLIKPNGQNGGDPYECNVCQKTFAVPARLIRHYRTHTGERPFECEFCHKLFSVKENLQVHRRIHTKERPYKCDVCGRAFEHSGKLHRHMRIHTGERPHKCSVCGKTFIQSGQLVIHMRTHTGEKPYKCPVEACGKGFTCSKQLKVHSRTHTGEKPYHCDICFRDFGYNHVLKLHRVQHYGSKCYKCTICEETFKSKKEMEAHIKGHANELPDDGDETVASSSETTSLTAANAEATDLSLAPVASLSSQLTVSGGQVRKPRRSTTTNTVTSKQKSSNNNNNASFSSPCSPSYSPTSCTLSPSPLSTSSSLSSSPSSSSSSSPSLRFNIETDQSHDSGVLSISLRNGINSSIDELPTDLRVLDVSETRPSYNNVATTTTTDTAAAATSITFNNHEEKYKSSCHSSNVYRRYQARSLSPQELQYQNLSTSSYILDVNHMESQKQQNHYTTSTKINPALLEAASIASRCAAVHEEDDNKAAISIMELRNNLLGSHQQQQQQRRQYGSITNELEQKSQRSICAGTIETRFEQSKNNENIIQSSSAQKRYMGVTPVPQYEPSLLNNEIVRQVEAAIAPLRPTSTESAERVSSPESDSVVMLADRDIMTLPLRKRKIYMSENQPKPPSSSSSSSSSTIDGSGSDTTVPKVMRISSVIQFAKAS